MFAERNFEDIKYFNQLNYRGKSVKIFSKLLPYDRINEVILPTSIECCTDLFKKYDFRFEDKHAPVNNVYRYLTVMLNTTWDHDSGTCWSIDLCEHYVADVKYRGYVELKNLEFTSIWLAQIDIDPKFKECNMDRYEYYTYDNDIDRAMRRSVYKFDRGIEVSWIGHLQTSFVDTSDEIKIYDFTKQ